MTIREFWQHHINLWRNRPRQLRVLKWFFATQVIIFGFIFLATLAGWFCYTSPAGLCREVDVACEPLREIPALADVIASLRVDLPRIQKYLEDQFAKGKSKEIDIILQTHELYGRQVPASAAHDPVLASQYEVYATLKRGHYDLVGAEGFETESLSFDVVDQAVFAEAEQSRGYPLTSEEREKYRMKDKDAEYWGPLRYIHEVPACESIGLERKSAIALHNLMGNAPPEIGDNLRYQRCYELVSRLRSQIALARVIERLDKTRKRRAALVIGFKHGSEVECCRRHLEIAGVTIDTVPSWDS